MSVRFTPAGDLGERLTRNAGRLEAPRYRPVRATVAGEGLFREEGYAWPGDFEGRTLLAWTLLERSIGRCGQNLSQALKSLPAQLNADGYLGPLAEEGVHDEQQLAGHGWLLRALCETWQDSQDASIYAMIERIVTNLALPTAGSHATYPIDPSKRLAGGGSFIGERSESIGGWTLSTDIGCGFIFLDGVAQAATIVENPAVDQLVNEIIARFLQVDLIGVGAQTHASLTGIRALLRWSRHTGRDDLLTAAIERFQLYLLHGASENHANWNWFGRPSHTEPCAVVDAFMIACQLWERTNAPRWLEEAQRIFYNGLGHAQRAHGGFGCDSVLGGDPDQPELLHVAMDEAWWCCTMRGAEGLSTARDYAVRVMAGEFVFPFMFSGRFEVDPSEGGAPEIWACETTYPSGESLSLRRLRSDQIGGHHRPVDLAFFVPSWADRACVTLDGVQQEGTIGDDQFLRVHLDLRPTSQVHFSMSMQTYWDPVRNPTTDRGLSVVRRGPLLYGLPGTTVRAPRAGLLEWDVDRECVTMDTHPMTPLSDMLNRSDLADYRRRVLFALTPAEPPQRPRSRCASGPG